MANRQKGFGLTAEVNRKLAAKYEVEEEQEARLWMEACVGQEVYPGADRNEPLGPDRLHEALKDGVYLCKLASIVTQRPVKHNESKMAFKQMENIGKFLDAAEKFGVNKTDLFQTVDLYEKTNMWQVVCAIHAFGRKAQANGAPVPVLGPKEASKNVRTFTEEQLTAGKNVIGLQMGTNQVASQKGMSFGGQRHIADIKCDDMSKEGQAEIGLQMGSNKGASQKGMAFGTSRHIADIKCDDVSREGQSVIGLQSGSNQGATASGQNFGKSRGIIGTDK